MSSAASTAGDGGASKQGTPSHAAQANKMTTTIDTLYNEHTDAIYAVFIGFTQDKANKRYTTHHGNAIPVAAKFVSMAIQTLANSGQGDDDAARGHLKILTQSANAKVELYNKLCKKHKEDQQEARNRSKSDKLARREEVSRAKDLDEIRRQHSGNFNSASDAVVGSSQPRASRSQTRRHSERSEDIQSDEVQPPKCSKRVRISDEHTYHDDE